MQYNYDKCFFKRGDNCVSGYLLKSIEGMLNVLFISKLCDIDVDCKSIIVVIILS